MGEKSTVRLQQKPLNIVFIGRGHAAKHCFAALVNSEPFRCHHLVGVVTKTINPINKVVCYSVCNLAKHLNVDVFSDDINSLEGIHWLDSVKPDLGIMFGYPQKLSKEMIQRFNRYILNIHPSDLPKHRGNFPLHQQIMQNDPLVVTVHKADPFLDRGPWTYKTAPLDVSYLTNEEVYGLMKQQAALAILAVMEKISQGLDLPFHEQDELSASYATGAVIGKSLQKIDWEHDVHSICAIIRASGTRMGIPASLTTQSGQVVEGRIHSAYELCQMHDQPPGQIIAYENGSYKVAAKGGFLILEDLRDVQGKQLLLKSLSQEEIEHRMALC